MNRLAKPADASEGLVGSRSGALLRRFNLAVALWVPKTPSDFKINKIRAAR